METWTVTFGESVENHVGMQMIGNITDKGFSLEDIESIQSISNQNGYTTDLYDLDNHLPFFDPSCKAQLLIVRNGLKLLLGDDMKGFISEIKGTNELTDKKAWMRGRVVNKRARYNLCYAEESQEPDYERKRGRIIAFDDTVYVKALRNALGVFPRCSNLFAELNHYYDSSCGIGFHGDAERRLVVGVRIGDGMNLEYQWFHESKPVGERFRCYLNEGDIYFMSEKATGTDWKKRKIPTLRHAAGAAKYTFIKEK